MSQVGRACRNRATNASAPAEDSEAARGEQRKWNSFGTPATFPASVAGALSRSP